MEQEQTADRPPLIERVRARQARHRERNRIYRIVFAVLGFVVLAAGVVMLVTPGPGIPVIIIGLGMLALEFAWAERWLERLLERAEQAVDQVTQGSPLRRALLLGAGVVALVAIGVMIVLWDVPFFPG
ncbi:MAG TPA: PGPGW domain-containing protein [Gaiellaceae bacterium]